MRVANSLSMMKGAVAMAVNLKKMGCLMVGVRGGFSLLTKRVKSELGLDHVFSNELVFHDGKLVGYGLLVNPNKAQILKTAFGDMFSGMRKMAVVDGANDLDLFDFDMKVAFKVQEIVRKRADARVDAKNLRPKIGLAKTELGKETPRKVR